MAAAAGAAAGVKVGTARIAKVGVAVAVGSAADRPRAAQPAAASRQSSRPAKQQTRRIRGETGETDMHRHLGRSEEQEEQLHIVAESRWIPWGYLVDTRWIWSRRHTAVRLWAVPVRWDFLTPIRSGVGRPGAALLPPSSINHGLSVFTHADAVAAAATTGNRRGRWPLADDRTFPISNCFNDATSGAFYPGHRSGHEGLDFACAVGTPVHAMYGGVVVEIEDRDLAPYGQFVTLHSGTDPASNSGFLHKYAHLAAVAGAGVQLAAPVSKGQLLGVSGTSGGVEAHLHVHLQPFDWHGVAQPAENMPPHGANGDQIEITTAATRISGCMNFVCFLPASHGGPPVTFDFLRSFISC